MQIDKSIGERIAKYRNARHLTQRQLGEKVGVTKKAIYMLEKGERGTSLETLIAISETLHVSLDTLVKGKRKTIDCSDLGEDVYLVISDLVAIVSGKAND